MLADTHVRTASPPRRGASRGLPLAAWRRLDGADTILHAGDVLDAGFLELLAAAAPVHAVLGNNDHDLVGVLPTTRTLDLGGVSVGMIHDSGPTSGRARRLRRRFPRADLVVFGHSHAPLDEEGEDGQRLFNPGSPTQRRAQPVHTLGEIRVADGTIVDHRVIPLEDLG